MVDGEKPRKPDRPRWATDAVVCSTTMCPGMGQLMQRRWLAGLFYVLSFLGVFVLVVVEFWRALVALYRVFLYELHWTLVAAGWRTYLTLAGTPPPLSSWPLFWAFVLFLLLYSANVLDVIMAAKRLGMNSTPPPVPKGEP